MSTRKTVCTPHELPHSTTRARSRRAFSAAGSEATVLSMPSVPAGHRYCCSGGRAICQHATSPRCRSGTQSTRLPWPSAQRMTCCALLEVHTAPPVLPASALMRPLVFVSVSYTHLRAHETPEHLVCRLLLE